MSMKIAYPMRIDAFDKPGGDLNQIQAYIKGGQRAAGTAGASFAGEIIVDLTADLSRFDIVHLTNIDRPVEAFAYYLSARRAGKPIVLSSLHHSYREIERYEKEGRGGKIGLLSGRFDFRRLELLRNFIRSGIYPQMGQPTWNVLRYGVRNAQRSILDGVDRILVLTDKERVDIVQDFGGVANHFACVRNGYEKNDHEISDETEAHRDLDVCVVGRIEARKNQIKILEVLEKLKLSGIFIGRENSNHRGYCRAFKSRIATSASQYLPGLSHAETLQYMRRSRIHVSASWFEVASLVDLEAYGAGCAVVSSRCGGTHELLGQRAEYVDPGNSHDIERGIIESVRKIGRGRVRYSDSRQLDFDSWDAIARQLSGIYQQLRRSA
jgi:glycosyltransferase involved in cell wall biosynthesis